MCSNFFNGEEKAPSCFLEQAETGGHLGVDLGLQRVTGWPLCFTMERGWAFIFQVGVGGEQAQEVLVSLVCRVLAQANQGPPETPAPSP